MRKLFALAASMLVCMASYAQWTKPSAPAMSDMVIGEECYLYNKDAGGFLVGANDYGTRASVSPTLGHKIYIEKGTAEGSYYIGNYVLQGGMKDKVAYMYMYSWDGIWVDQTKTGSTNNQYTFEKQEDGTYKIGVSPENENVNPTVFLDAYLGTIIPENDTKVYLCYPFNIKGYTLDQFQMIWYFVSPANYQAFTTAVVQYNSAMTLAATISKAEQTAGVDQAVLTAAKDAYANTSSTAEVLQACNTSLEEAILHAQTRQATADAPIEVLSLLGIATDFNDTGTSGWESTTGAAHKQAVNANNAANSEITGNHYENWSGEPFTPGKIYATAKYLLPGVYRLSALAFSSADNCSYLFAGPNRRLVTSKKIDVEEPMDVYTVVSSAETLTVGLDVTVKAANWVGLDNVGLYYLGSSQEALAKYVAETIAAEPDYDTMMEDGGLMCQKAVYDAYCTARTALQNAANVTEAETLYAAFAAASTALAENVAAYNAFEELVHVAEDFLSSTTSSSDEVALLSDYLIDDSPAGESYNGNGSVPFILANCVLDVAQLSKECEYLERLINNAKANAKEDGDDCTDLLQNPRFAESGGWQGVTNASIVWPRGNTDDFPVVEAYNVAFNIYQELPSLQNGLYELTLQSAFRPGDIYSDEYEALASAYAYINSFETKIPSGNAPGLAVVNDANQASDAFAAGYFPVRVYGLVTDGTMRLGITNKVRNIENCVLWAGDVKLTFRGKNAEVLTNVISQTMPVANALLSSKAGNAEISALSAAISNSETAEDKYEALVNLKKAMENVEQGTQLYAEIAVALKNLSDAIDNSTNADEATLTEASNLLSSSQAAYDGQKYDNEAAQQAIVALNSMAVAVKLGTTEPTTEPVDYTSAIVNNNFDPARGDKANSTIEGWTTTTLNGYKEYTASYNKNTFALSQKLSGLPKGNYKLTVHAYYRAGSYEEEETNINNGVDTHLAKFYAQTSENLFEKAVMNLSEGGVTSAEDVPEGVKTKTINGVIVPDGTSASVAFYNKGYYLNELEFTVGEDGEATIGMHLDKTIGSNDYVVVGEWKLWYLGDNEAELEGKDVTSLIVNNNFDPARGDKNTSTIEGWTTTTLNGYKQNTASYNKNTFSLSQKLSGLPEGTYKVTVHAFYRAGSYEEEEANINKGVDTHLAKFYAATTDKTWEKPLMNLSEGGVTSMDDVPAGVNTRTINGIIVPDGTAASVEFYKRGYYLNELPFYVGNDGDVTIGMHLDKTIGSNDYVVVGEWKLYYYGSGNIVDDVTGIENVVATENSLSDKTPVAVYSISGIALPSANGKIQIVVMKDGTARKILRK